MLPAHFHDVTDEKSRSGNLIWYRSQCEIQEQSRNDKYHTTSNIRAKHEYETTATREQ